MSVRRQCELRGLSRSSLYYEAAVGTEENLRLPRVTAWLVSQVESVNRKRVRRLLRLMGLEAIYPKPRLSANRNHKVYPYLLRNVAVKRVDQVWSADITYVPLPSGFMYLAATIDWYSRYVLA